MSIFGALGKIAGKAFSVVPGLSSLKGIAGIAGPIAGKFLKRNARKVVAVAAAAGAGGVAFAKRNPAAVAVMGAGAITGASLYAARGRGEGRVYRRINPGNTKAMRRAVRRIEQGARLYSKFFGMKTGHIKGAPHVRVKKLSIRRAA